MVGALRKSKASGGSSLDPALRSSLRIAPAAAVRPLTTLAPHGSAFAAP